MSREGNRWLAHHLSILILVLRALRVIRVVSSFMSCTRRTASIVLDVVSLTGFGIYSGNVWPIISDPEISHSGPDNSRGHSAPRTEPITATGRNSGDSLQIHWPCFPDVD